MQYVLPLEIVTGHFPVGQGQDRAVAGAGHMVLSVVPFKASPSVPTSTPFWS
jgi:hypothetical protein